MANEIKIKLTVDGKEAIATFDLTDEKIKKLFKNANTSGAEMFSTLKKIAASVGLAFGINEIVSFTKEAVLASAELEVLRSNFRGSAEDIELFKKATAGTVSEAGLLKLSNQATDLGLSIQDQAKLFYLAENAADKYGGSLEENFQKVVFATEGNTRGLRLLGIQKAVYENIVNSLAAAHGKEIKDLDAETQKMIRTQAVLQATGVTMESVANQTSDAKDRFEKLGVQLETLWVGIGDFLRDSVYGWADLIMAISEGGPIGLGVFMDMNMQLDSIANNMRMIKEMYSEAIAFAGTQAENAVSGKSAPEIQKMIKDTNAKIRAMEKLGKKEGFNEDTKNDLEQQKRKLQVYQSTLDLMNFTGKKDAEKAAKEFSAKMKNEQKTYQEAQKEKEDANKKYYDDVTFTDKKYFDWKMEQYQLEAAAMWLANGDKAKADKWLMQQYKKLKGEETKYQGYGKYEGGSGGKIGDYITASQKAIDDEKEKLRVDLLNTASDFSNQLARGLAKSGKSFINYLNIALQAAIKISDIILKMGTKEKGETAGILGIISSILPFAFMADGGIINEPVIGIGRSGRGYMLGEGGIPEAVIPINQLSSAAMTTANINLNIKIDSRTRGRDLENVVSKQLKTKEKYG